MNERTRASELLREARAILAQRLAERVLEQGEDLLADARGESYMNEIESLYEQVGLKLSHVNQMLSNLPVDAPAPPQSPAVAAQHAAASTFTVATEPTPCGDVVVHQTMPALPGPPAISPPGLPAPRSAETGRVRATTSALQAFAAQIQAGDLLAAGRTLAILFDVEEPRAVACAATFAQRVRKEAAFFRKVMELRVELHSADTQRALLLLLDCFGLSRGESAEILRNLQRRRRAGHG